MPDQIKLKVNQNNEDRFRAASEAAGADWSKRNDFFTTLALQAVEQGLHLPNDEASAILESEVASGSNLADDHAETRAVVAGYFKQFFQQLNEKRDAVAVHLASQIADRISQSGQSTSEEITAAGLLPKI